MKGIFGDSHSGNYRSGSCAGHSQRDTDIDEIVQRVCQFSISISRLFSSSESFPLPKHPQIHFLPTMKRSSEFLDASASGSKKLKPSEPFWQQHTQSVKMFLLYLLTYTDIFPRLEKELEEAEAKWKDRDLSSLRHTIIFDSINFFRDQERQAAQEASHWEQVQQEKEQYESPSSFLPVI